MSKHIGCRRRNIGQYWPIGNIIQKWQIENNVTNQQLADRAGISVRTLARMKCSGLGSISTIEDLLWIMDMELTACPIGGNRNGNN